MLPYPRSGPTSRGFSRPAGGSGGQAWLNAVTQAAVLSAHGNSGAIIAAMLAGVGQELGQRQARTDQTSPGVLLGGLLGTAAQAARRAVARPVAGTILTVAQDTADAAGQASSEHATSALAVALAAQAAARDSLARTPDQLAVLADAGVVDAGAQAYVLLIDVIVEALGGPAAEPLLAAEVGHTRPGPGRAIGSPPEEYEVMYALRGADPTGLDALREELSERGRSVVIVGDETVAQVHVHLGDAGAAIEAALGRGRLSQIRITALAPDAPAGGRSVIAAVAGAGLAAAVASLGGTPVLTEPGETLERLTLAAAGSHGDLVVLPNDMETLEIASHLAATVRAGGRRVAVIPTVAQAQGLAALAVHEPSADFDSAVVAMSRAAGHARHGAVTIAEGSAMTMAGRCEAGDVLGAVEGDFVEIGDSVNEVGWSVVRRLLSAGGELLTVICGAGADQALARDLHDRVRRHAPGVDVEVLDGGQPRYLLLLGLE